MAEPQMLTEGFDPTGLTQITLSQLLQMIREATPTDPFGFVINGSGVPSGVYGFTDLDLLEKFIYKDTDTGTTYWFTQPTTWTPTPTGTITSASQITNGTVTLAKLAEPGVPNALYILRANSGGTGYELVNIISAITNGTLTFNKLVAGTEGQLLYFTGGAWTPTTFSFLGLINSYIAQISYLTLNPNSGTPLSLLRINAGGTSFEVATLSQVVGTQSLPTTVLVGGTGNVGKVPTVQSDGTVVLTTPASGPTSYRTADASLVAVPTSNGTEVSFSHGLGGIPSQWWFTLVCQTTNLGYAVGEEVVLPGGSILSGDNVSDPVAYWANSATINVGPMQWAARPIAIYSRSSPGTLVAITTGSWKIRGYAVKYP